MDPLEVEHQVEPTERARQDTREDVEVTQVQPHIQGQAVVAEEPL